MPLEGILERSLEELQAEFLAKGGEVNAVPTGMSALSGVSLAPLTFTNHDIDRRKAAKDHRIAAQKYSLEDDLALVALIHQFKETTATASSLCRELNCTHSRLQRVIRDHLKDDPMIDRFRQMAREDRRVEMNRILAGQIRQHLLEGVTGIYAMASLTGASTPRINSVAKRYKLVIPKGAAPDVLMPNCIAVPRSQLESWRTWVTEQRFIELECAIAGVLKEAK